MSLRLSRTYRITSRVKFSVEESGSSSRPSTPAVRGKLGQISRPSTPNITASHRHTASHALHPKQPIQTPQQFYDWFALIDRSVTHSQEAHIRAHLGAVSDHLETCDKLVQRIDEIDHEVEDMLQGWRSVEESGRSLKDACEQLLQERVSTLRSRRVCGRETETRKSGPYTGHDYRDR